MKGYSLLDILFCFLNGLALRKTTRQRRDDSIITNTILFWNNLYGITVSCWHSRSPLKLLPHIYHNDVVCYKEHLQMLLKEDAKFACILQYDLSWIAVLCWHLLVYLKLIYRYSRIYTY